MSEPAARSDARPLGLVMASALVAGNIVGSGIFATPTRLAPYGGAALLGWVLTTAGSLLLATTFAWLARVQPAATSLHAYTRSAFGTAAAAIVAWSYWISIWTATAAIAVAMVGYLGVLVPPLADSAPAATATALFAVWSLTAVNVRGVRGAGALQVVLTILKLAPLAALVACGIASIEPSHFTPLHPPDQTLWHATNASAVIALWALVGFESATVAAGRIRDPERNVARATLLGAVIAATITIVACTTVAGLVPPAELASSPAPFAAAARTLWGPTGAIVIAATGVLSCLGALNGWILLQGQLPQAMARDGLFPARAAKDNSRGAPTFTLVLGTALASLLILVNREQRLVAMFATLSLIATVAVLVVYLFSSAAALRLLRGSAVALTPLRIAVIVAGFAYAVWALAGVEF